MLFDRTKTHNIVSKYISDIITLQKQTQTGNTLVVGISIGLVALGGTTITLINAGKNQTNVISEEETKQVLAITEAGIHKSISTLNQSSFRYLMMINYDSKISRNPWRLARNLIPSKNTDTLISPPANPCNTADVNRDGIYNIVDHLSNLASAQNNNPSFINAVNATIGLEVSEGNYKLISYTYSGDAANGGTGKIKIKGTTSRNAFSSSIYDATFTVSPKPSTAKEKQNTPSLLANRMNLGKLNAYANLVICTDFNQCRIPANSCRKGEVTLNPNNDTDYSKLKTALGLNSINGRLLTTTAQSDKNSNIQIGMSRIPPISIATSGTKILSIDMKGNNIVKTIEPSLTRGDFSLDNNNNKIWYYQIDNMATNSSLYVNVANVGENDQVRLYFNNDLKITGSDGIMPINSNVNDLNQKPTPVLDKIKTIRILGGNADGTPLTSVQNWDLGGTSCIMGQIHAPNANIDFSNGNGCRDFISIKDLTKGNVKSNDSPNVYGTIWSNSITNKTGNASIFFENTALVTKLAQEYEPNFYDTGKTISMGSSYNLTRVEQ